MQSTLLRCLVLIVLLILVGIGKVLADGVIKGIVIDKKTQEPVIGATVIVENTTMLFLKKTIKNGWL